MASQYWWVPDITLLLQAQRVELEIYLAKRIHRRQQLLSFCVTKTQPPLHWQPAQHTEVRTVAGRPGPVRQYWSRASLLAALACLLRCLQLYDVLAACVEVHPVDPMIGV